VEAADLEGQAMILHEKGSAPRIATENFIRKNNLNVSYPLELSNNEAIKRAVEQGIGIAVITRRVANEEIQTGMLKAIPFSDPTLTRKFYLIHHKDKYLSKTLLNLIDLVAQWTAEYIQGRS
jgi:DNA-binding transcriptional LysR family regulator